MNTQAVASRADGSLWESTWTCARDVAAACSPCVAEAVNGFVAARVVTTLTILALLIGAVSLMS